MIAPLIVLILLSGAPGTSERTSCLERLGPKHQAVSEYDRQHDYVPDFSYSCLYRMTASEVQRDLEEMRAAASKPGCSALRELLVYPFGVGLPNGRYVELGRQQVCRYASLIKDKIAESGGDLQPERLSSAGWRGLFTPDESIWLNTAKDKRGTLRLRLVRIGLEKTRHETSAER